MRLYHDMTPPPSSGKSKLVEKATTTTTVKRSTTTTPSPTADELSTDTMETICKIYCENKAVMDLCNTKYLGRLW